MTPVITLPTVPARRQTQSLATAAARPNQAARIRQAAAHRDELTHCVEMAFAGLIMLGALLFGASLLRLAVGIANGRITAMSIDCIAMAAAFATLFMLCRGVYHFVQSRKLQRAA